MPNSIRFGRAGAVSGLVRTSNLPRMDSFTWMAWICRRGVGDLGAGNDPGIVQFWNTGNTNAFNIFFRGANDGGTGALVVVYNGSTSNNTSSLTQDQWYHTCLTSDGTTMTWYLDGVVDFSSAPGAVFTTAAQMVMGMSSAGAEWADINLGALKIWNRALSIAEIGNEMPYAMPVSWAGLNDCRPFPQAWEQLTAERSLLLPDRGGVITPWSDYSGNDTNWAVTGAIDTDLGPPIRFAPPLTRDRAIGKATSGGTTFTHTPSGGLQSGGTATRSLTKRAAPAGGLQSGGLATLARKFGQTPSGGLQSGGNPTKSLIKRFAPAGGISTGGTGGGIFVHAFIHVPSGGLHSGGTSTLVRKYGQTPSGGLQAGGSAAQVIKHAIVALGGLQSGGVALVSHSVRFVPSGGLHSGGAATVNTTNARVVVPSGGMHSGGVALVNAIRSALASGGLHSGGAAPNSTSKRVVSAGGLQSSGAATIRRVLVVPVSGGLHSGGVGAIVFIDGNALAVIGLRPLRLRARSFETSLYPRSYDTDVVARSFETDVHCTEDL